MGQSKIQEWLENGFFNGLQLNDEFYGKISQVDITLVYYSGIWSKIINNYNYNYSLVD